jgi:ABC-type transport system substrate-binding protein
MPPISRRRFNLALTAIAASSRKLAGAAPHDAPPAEVLRYAFLIAETSLDPVKVNDTYSRTVTPHIFEALYAYDPLARPVKIRPLTAAAMPEVSEDFRVWTVRVQPGIFFAADPAFGGKPRELVAADYVYSFMRIFDPALKSPSYSTLKDEGIVGLEESRARSLAAGKPFDYDRPVEGLRALDRYTIEFRLAEPRPRFMYTLASSDILGAMAREVVEAYGDAIMAHPVGTGPFRLAQWRRSSLIVLERNPDFRAMRYDAEPAADDAKGQAILARFRGRTLPMIDRVEIGIIDEGQPRWLSFLNAQHDLLQNVPFEFAELAAPGGKLAPNLARRGVGMQRQVQPDVTLTVYNMEDPVVGGYTAEKVALRRALDLAYDVQREIEVVRHGQAVPAQSIVPPHTFGYDPSYRSENGVFDLGRAKALLDIYGYVDRDGDGYREMPDGSPLTIVLSNPPDQVYRLLTELRKKSLDALGVRLSVRIGNWAEQLKAARAGNFMVWTVGSTAATPDGQGALERGYGPASGGGNLARFRLAAFDRIYEEMKGLPDGLERQRLFTRANNLLVAYAPYKVHVHRIVTDLWQPWLEGYRRPLFWQEFWQYVDVGKR